jgi:hypothetical protein
MKLSVKVKSVEFISDTCVEVGIKLPGRGCIHMKMHVNEDFWKKLEAEIKNRRPRRPSPQFEEEFQAMLDMERLEEEIKSIRLLNRRPKGPSPQFATWTSNPLR